MLLNGRVVLLLLEAAASAGFPRAELVTHAHLNERSLADPRFEIEWSVFVGLADEISRRANGDAERLRNIGRAMNRAPAYAPFRAMARTLVSVRTLYEIANKWVAPANFPHLPLRWRFSGDDRLTYDIDIPASYAASEAFFRIFEGAVIDLPVLIGLPPSRVIESRITARTIHLDLRLPRSHGFFARVRRSAKAVLHAPTALNALEGHRQALAESVAALQQARDELRALLENLPDPVVVHADGKVLWANRAFVSSLGWSKLEDVVGTPLLDHIAPRFRAEAAIRMRAAVRPPSDAHLLREVALLTRDGAEIVTEVAPAQAVVFDGVPARLVTGRNVTERVRMQQKLIVADRLASIGLLAAGVAHEVNNPLGYVLNNIEIARRELNGRPDTELAREVLSVALQGVDRIRSIVRDLLMLARGGDETAAAIDVRAVAESTLSLAAREIERTAHLVKDFQPVPMVWASESRLAQVLLNLISNALEAMQDRPIEANELAVRVVPEGETHLRIEVGDTGPGIAEADIARLFEPFFTTKPAEQGTGLGLPIAQRIVVEMGGEIGVRSTLGKGTTFYVILPATLDDGG